MFAYKLHNQTHWKFNYPNRQGNMSGSSEKVFNSIVIIDLTHNLYHKERVNGYRGVKVKDKRLLNRLHRKAKKSNGEHYYE